MLSYITQEKNIFIQQIFSNQLLSGAVLGPGQITKSHHQRSPNMEGMQQVNKNYNPIDRKCSLDVCKNMSGPQRRVSLNLQSISFSSKIIYQPPKLDQGQSQFMHNLYAVLIYC